ncbi:hypothetical protein JOM56_014444 [Amanita muscaria]
MDQRRRGLETARWLREYLHMSRRLFCSGGTRRQKIRRPQGLMKQTAQTVIQDGPRNLEGFTGADAVVPKRLWAASLGEVGHRIGHPGPYGMVREVQAAIDGNSEASGDLVVEFQQHSAIGHRVQLSTAAANRLSIGTVSIEDCTGNPVHSRMRVCKCNTTAREQLWAIPNEKGDGLMVLTVWIGLNQLSKELQDDSSERYGLLLGKEGHHIECPGPCEMVRRFSCAIMSSPDVRIALVLTTGGRLVLADCCQWNCTYRGARDHRTHDKALWVLLETRAHLNARGDGDKWLNSHVLDNVSLEKG